MGETQTHTVEECEVARGAQEKGKAATDRENVLGMLHAQPGGQGSWAGVGEGEGAGRQTQGQHLLLEACS